jgi:hypothetical protein
MKTTINLSLLFLIALAITLGCKNSSKIATQSENSAQSSTTVEPSTAPEVVSKVTAASFAKIKTGMRYEQVVEILGQDGEVLSESEFGSTKTVMYQWKGEGFGANMNAMFQNDKLINKSQFGLK